jgi:hypothetical protein
MRYAYCALRSYAAAIQRHLGEKLSDREAARIAEGLRKLVP